MKYDPEKHRRRSIRLKNYDYSRKGAYFVTICTYQKEDIFGWVIDGEMVLKNAWKMVKEENDHILNSAKIIIGFSISHKFEMLNP